MDINQANALASSAVIAAIPLMLAGGGELVTEKSGVVNLGVEGMMLMGAVSGYAAASVTGNAWLGLVGGVLAGAAMALVFAFLTITMLANQIATGLALTIFGIGFSAYFGKPYSGAAAPSMEGIAVPWLSSIPIAGPSLFQLTIPGYLSFAALLGIGMFLYRSGPGLILRAVGESPEVAHAVGFPVARIRYAATLFGGAMAGLAGSYYSIIYLHMWQEQLTVGRGWIVVALVVFSTWRPGRLMAGALLFGAITSLQFYGQTIGLPIPTQFLSMLPYLATIFVLVLISRNKATVKQNAPVSLGKVFFAAA
jgi:general nucleoside transport system permease protein